MTNEREQFFQPLTLVDYDIAGNSFRAYYDADRKLVFVIDFLIDDIKPNVLLVINPVGDRKWDDILENDYGVDLETVRPKKNNKYQKLDIEYAGLAQYDDLIHAYESGVALNASLNALTEFRHVAAQRSAMERLGAAELTASRSRETIDKTNDKIAELQDRVKTLRQKLIDAKRAIGKEPTKQSASKILRIESQIDATNAKLKRAKRRLNNAQRRLDAAEDEMDVAQYILNKLNINLPASPAPAEIMVATSAPVPAEIPETQPLQPKAENMADDEVKPLFDTEPNIIDEEIAFKPIDFGAPVVSTEPVAPVVNVTQNVSAPVVATEPVAASDDDVDDVIAEEQETLIQPLSFTPPTEFTPDDIRVDATEEFEDTPVYDDEFKPVPLMSEQADAEVENTPVFEGFTPIPLTADQVNDAIWNQPVPEVVEQKPVQDVLAPVETPVPETEPVVAASDIQVAPVSSDFRPVSPIANDGAAAPVPVVGAPVQNSKPTMLYYVLLIVLIVLSVFTLWIYQNSANDAMPELGTKTEPVAPVEEVVTTEVAEVAEPEIDPEPVVVEPVAIEPEPVVIPEIEPAVVTVTEPVVETTTVAEVVPVTTEPVVAEVEEDTVADTTSDSPFIELETLGPVIGPVVEEVEEEPVAIPSEEEILASKPAYGTTSRSDEMFVAADEYETDVDIVAPVEEVSAPVVEIAEPTVVTEYAEEEYIEEETCSDGNPPDMYGCCTGEDFVLLPDGERACCAESTGECFPPM